MALINWHPNFSINIEEIDKQHQLLVKMINDLYGSWIINLAIVVFSLSLAIWSCKALISAFNASLRLNSWF